MPCNVEEKGGASASHPSLARRAHHEYPRAEQSGLPALQRQLAVCKLLIIDELGYVPLSQTDAELLFEVLSQRY
jgi:DNA replication protein DnaC